MAYYDEQATAEARIGQAVYQGALDDRRGFRPDHVGLDTDEDLWDEIFFEMGAAALKAIAAEGQETP